MHISEQVAAELISQGWSVENGYYRKVIENFEPAGSFSNGRRNVILSIDESGRWFERLTGWGKLSGEVDLREYRDNPKAAIAAILK